jgi:hypothetical protein
MRMNESLFPGQQALRPMQLQGFAPYLLVVCARVCVCVCYVEVNMTAKCSLWPIGIAATQGGLPGISASKRM